MRVKSVILHLHLKLFTVPQIYRLAEINYFNSILKTLKVSYQSKKLLR